MGNRLTQTMWLPRGVSRGSSYPLYRVRSCLRHLLTLLPIPYSGRDAPTWVFTDACNLIQHIIVDVAAPELQSVSRADVEFTNMLITFSTYLSTVAETFPNLRSLRLCFQHRLVDSQGCPSVDLRTALLEAVDKLRCSLAEACQLEVLPHTTRNYNALSPLVTLRRDEQTISDPYSCFG
jgi:hypothetical protein